jgi:hypothetical protein
MNEKTVIFCQNCQEERDIKKNHCAGCGEQICGKCGCTDSEACLENKKQDRNIESPNRGFSNN